MNISSSRRKISINREGSPTGGEVNEFFIGDQHPLLVQIPPRVLHGFKGVGTEEALVVNIPSEPYNPQQPDEYRLPPNEASIPYNWATKER